MIKEDKFINYKLNSLGRPPREQLVEFLNKHQQEVNDGKITTALDLGCGGCIETCLLASKGLKVTALDAVIPNQIKNACKDALSPEDLTNIKFDEQNFQYLNLPKADLVWSFAAMPFCPKDSFGQMLSKSIMAVNSNGYFAAHFFDKTHPFITLHGNTGVTAEQIQQIFDYVGFDADVRTFKSERTQNGQYTQDLNNVYVVAKAPEQLKELSLNELANKIDEILELQQGHEVDSEMQKPETETIQDQPSGIFDRMSHFLSNASHSLKAKLGLEDKQNAENLQSDTANTTSTLTESNSPIQTQTESATRPTETPPADFTP